MQKRFVSPVLVLCLSACVGHAMANVPFPGISTCTVTITQFPIRTACLSDVDWIPDVVRLTPGGSSAVPVFDRVSLTLRARDAIGEVVSGALVAFSEQSGIVNIANGGSTTAITDATGLATVELHGASGYGRVALCADGVQLCNLVVRSPDVAKGALPSQCGIGTATSSVSGADIVNPDCGFFVHFGQVVAGVNDRWDLNCDMSINGFDVNGVLGKGGVLQYFGDTGTPGLLSSCVLP